MSKKIDEKPRVPFVFDTKDELDAFDKAIAKAFLANRVKDMTRSGVIRQLIQEFVEKNK